MSIVPINIQNSGPKIPSTEFSVKLSIVDLNKSSREDELTSLLTILCTFETIFFIECLSINSRLIKFDISFTLEIRLFVARQLDKPNRIGKPKKMFSLDLKKNISKNFPVEKLISNIIKVKNNPHHISKSSFLLKR